MAAFHLHDGALGLAAVVVNECDDAVNTLIGAFLAFLAVSQSRPVGALLTGTVPTTGIDSGRPRPTDGQMRSLAAHPLPRSLCPAPGLKASFSLYFCRAMDRWVTSMPIHLRPSFCAAAMVVPHPQNGSRTTSPGLLLACNDAFQQGKRFLSWVAKTFGSLRIDRVEYQSKHCS